MSEHMLPHTLPSTPDDVRLTRALIALEVLMDEVPQCGFTGSHHGLISDIEEAVRRALHAAKGYATCDVLGLDACECVEQHTDGMESAPAEDCTGYWMGCEYPAHSNYLLVMQDVDDPYCPVCHWEGHCQEAEYGCPPGECDYGQTLQHRLSKEH